MAMAAREYYYEDYRSGASYRTPPLNVAELRYAGSGGYASGGYVEYGGARAYAPYYGPYAPYAPAEPAWPARRPARPVIVPDAPPGRHRRRRAETQARRFHYARISAKEKAFILTSIVVLGAVFMAIILLSSYHAYMQNQVNVTKAAAAAVQEDIDEIRVSIEKSNTIGNIESQAIQQFGMDYPKEEQIVYLDDVGEAADG